MDRLFCAALHCLPRISHSKLIRIRELGFKYQEAWEVLSASLLEKIEIKQEYYREILERRENFKIERFRQYIEEHQIQIIPHEDTCFPKSTLETRPVPCILYGRGNTALLKQQHLGIVGTRRITSYGKQVIEKFIPALSPYNICIVSGLAYGVDAYAQKKVVEQRGKTIAVLGSGVDVVYPSSSNKLTKEILGQQGLLLSEFPIGTKATSFHFPLRNRIIAALSKVVLVIEAGDKSGSVITAHAALEQGKDVCVVPGSIFSPYSQGTNNLLVKGEAHCVTSPEEVLHLMGVVLQQEEKAEIPLDLPEDQRSFLEHFSFVPEEQEAIQQQSGLDIAAFQIQVSLLELAGVIQKVEGTKWVRVR